jgi:hypothetical protein
MTDAMREPTDRWLLGFRDICRNTDFRTMIAAPIPRVPCGHNLPLLNVEDPRRRALLAASLSSFVLDFAARQKVGGTHMTAFIVKQLPVPVPDDFDAPCGWEHGTILAQWILDRVLELTFTAWDLTGFGADLGWMKPPFRWDENRRALLRAELDAAFFHLYGIERDDVDYIMETFPIVKRKDGAAYGEYRTKRLILEVYDAIAKAVETGEPYQTILDPPPADPSCAHPESTRPDWARA